MAKNGRSDQSEDRLWARPPTPGALKSYLGDLPQSAYFEPDFDYPLQRIMPRHGDIDSHEFQWLADLAAQSKGTARQLAICIVTFEFEGPTYPGGLATEYYRFAKLLAEAGHAVTVLFMRGENCQTGNVADWITHFAASDIEFVPLPASKVPTAPSIVNSATVRPRAAHEWLKTRSFDVVHATGARGAVYPALTAKRLGLGFRDTIFVMHAWPPTLWGAAVDGEPVLSLRTLAFTHMERRCFELADIVVSPSRHMLRWMMRNGYDLRKAHCFVHPGFLEQASAADEDETQGDLAVTNAINEVVFIGSLDLRKGLGAFLRAVDGLAAERPGLRFCVYGTSDPTPSPLSREGVSASVKFEEIERVDEVATGRLNSGQLVVLPPMIDRSPELISRCLRKSVPVRIMAGGGAPEWIAEIEGDAVVCDATPNAVAECISQALCNGAAPAQPILRPAEARTVWRKVHEVLGEKDVQRPWCAVESYRSWNGVAPLVRAPSDAPLVSVCIAHHNRPALLAHAIDSIRRQTYPKIEIVVVDDGSTSAESRAYLDKIQADFVTCGNGRVIRQANRYLGAVRNTGARHSSGEFILSLDDDDVLKPHEVETFVKTAGFSGADILCSDADAFDGTHMPEEGKQRCSRISPIGDAVSLGLFINCFGGSHSFVRRRVFDALGGHTEDYGVGLDDHEFSARAVMRGFKLMVVPEPLYWYRLSRTRLRDQHFDRSSGRERVFNAYLDNAPLALSEALRLAQAAVHELSRVRGERQKRGPIGWLRERRTIRAIRRSGLFDADYYLAENPDVAASGIDPVEHFVTYGVIEGRKPSPSFDPLDYLDDFPEVAAQGGNALVHFINARTRRSSRTAC